MKALLTHRVLKNWHDAVRIQRALKKDAHANTPCPKSHDRKGLIPRALAAVAIAAFLNACVALPADQLPGANPPVNSASAPPINTVTDGEAATGELTETRATRHESKYSHRSPLTQTLKPAIPLDTVTIAVQPNPPAQQESIPLPQATITPGIVSYFESTVTLPTYPYQQYQTPALDSATRWPYMIFDQDRFLNENPPPVNQTYRAIVLENRYLHLTILPELGGRLWQVIHKSSGNHLFYQNGVVKPSPWGPANQLGWLAMGGLEWNLPVIEHGYDWGTEWIVTPTQVSSNKASVTLSTPTDGRLLSAEITISLYADLASVVIQPTLVNLSRGPLQFDYWHTAMMAPGPENLPSADLHFVLPTREVSVHSTGDEALPAPGELMTWPRYRGRDLSILGNWSRYLGLFEFPAARGPFVGVYDRAYNAGGVRIYPPKTARGSKLFGLGWSDALSSDYFTDDGTAYVELHGGLAPSFFEQAELAGQESVSWRETWYPLQGIGDLTHANELVAIHLKHAESVLTVGLYPVLPIEGELIIEKAGRELFRQPIQAGPDRPFNSIISNTPKFGGEVLDIRLDDKLGRELLSYALR